MADIKATDQVPDTYGVMVGVSPDGIHHRVVVAFDWENGEMLPLCAVDNDEQALAEIKDQYEQQRLIAARKELENVPLDVLAHEVRRRVLAEPSFDSARNVLKQFEDLLENREDQS